MLLLLLFLPLLLDAVPQRSQCSTGAGACSAQGNVKVSAAMLNCCHN
jgi:hypothetical protein